MATTALQPIPTYQEVRPAAVLLSNLHALYGHYFFGSPLPAGFPESIINEFPNKSYKRQLKDAIAAQQTVVTNMETIQKQYLIDYNTLYLYYAYSVKLPIDFPQSILAEFPSKNYQQQLKEAMIELQNEMLKENE